MWRWDHLLIHVKAVLSAPVEGRFPQLWEYDVLNPMGSLLSWKDLVSVEKSIMTSTARSMCFFRCWFHQEFSHHWNTHGKTSVSHCYLTNGKTGIKCPTLDRPHWAHEPLDRFICCQQNLSKPDTDVIIWWQRCRSFTLSCSIAHRGFTVFIGFTTKRTWFSSLPTRLIEMTTRLSHCSISSFAQVLTAVQQVLHLSPSDQWSRQSCLLLQQIFLLDA